MSKPHINHAYSCVTCSWFGFMKERPKDSNRYCICPGKIFIKDGHCGCWKDLRTLKQKVKREHPVKSLCR